MYRLPGRRFSLDVVPERGVVRLEIDGELDVLTVRQVRERVAELVGAGFGEIVLDLRGLVFIDSTGMRLLVGLHHQAHRDGWRLSLIQGPESVRRVFEIAGTAQVLPFAPDPAPVRSAAMSRRTHEIRTPDGRTLRVTEAGAPDGPCVVMHHGTPASGSLFRTEVESAADRRMRLLAYDRPGYGGSSPDPGRSATSAAADVLAILDALGIDRFATYGVSGGGPHALACAALAGDRCAGALTIAGVGPGDAPDLDFVDGMGEGNHVEFAKVREGRAALSEFCREQAGELLEVRPEQLAEALRPHLSEVDAGALTGEFAEYLTDAAQRGLRPGVDGWVDDDLAFIAPWGFDVGDIDVPVAVWQGDQDLMVPAAHALWLAEHVAGAELAIVPGEGHLTLQIGRIGDAHAWLLDRLS